MTATDSKLHKYKWISLPEDESGEVFDVTGAHGKVWRQHLMRWDGEGYWGTELSYDYNSPIFDAQCNFTDVPKWATHIAWFNK